MRDLQCDLFLTSLAIVAANTIPVSLAKIEFSRRKTRVVDPHFDTPFDKSPPKSAPGERFLSTRIACWH